MKKILSVILALSLVLVSSVFANEEKCHVAQKTDEAQVVNTQESSRNLQAGNPSNPDEVSQGLIRKYEGANSQKPTKPRQAINKSVNSAKVKPGRQIPDSGDQTTDSEKNAVRINDLTNKKQTAEGLLLNEMNKTHETQSSVVNNIKP
ncbi:MAG: hypothetical protein PHI86_03465 [Candidatus Omnitrophica bacterium]|nr:hypothetical protein [Candidatus Omnitrophota bacterium]HOX54635.1 hypothetical protein [Candidatus Omnitrophota bacterium]